MADGEIAADLHIVFAQRTGKCYKFLHEFHENMFDILMVDILKLRNINIMEDSLVAKNEKRANFIRLAEGRTQSALDAIRKIGNLSNDRAYEYTDADIKMIVKALRDATAEVEKKFSSSTGETFNKFKLKA